MEYSSLRCYLIALVYLPTLFYPGHLIAQTIQAYVWEFSTPDGTRTDFTKTITEEFEEALFQHTNYSLLQRRKFARVFDQRENEKAVMQINNMPAPLIDSLEVLIADAVIFGSLVDDNNSGKVIIRINIETLNGKIIDKVSIDFPKLEQYDPAKRRVLLKQLAEKLKPVNIKKDVKPNIKPDNSVSNPTKKLSPLQKSYEKFHNRYKNNMYYDGIREFRYLICGNFKETGFFRNGKKVKLESWYYPSDEDLKKLANANELRLFILELGIGRPPAVYGYMAEPNRLEEYTFLPKINKLQYLTINECYLNDFFYLWPYDNRYGTDLHHLQSMLPNLLQLTISKREEGKCRLGGYILDDVVNLTYEPFLKNLLNKIPNIQKLDIRNTTLANVILKMGKRKRRKFLEDFFATHPECKTFLYE